MNQDTQIPKTSGDSPIPSLKADCCTPGVASPGLSGAAASGHGCCDNGPKTSTHGC